MRFTAYQVCPEGRWEVVDALPHARLRPGVRGYRGYRFDLGRPRLRLEIPDAVVTLVLNFDRKLRVSSAVDPHGPARSFTSLVSGLHTRATFGEHDGSLYGIEVVLAPWAAFTLLGTPMRQLADTMVDPVDLLGVRADDLVGALAATAGWARRFVLLDAVLLSWWAAGLGCSPQVRWAWDVLVRTGGMIPIRRLAAETEWSQRHLERRFREQIGLAPKAAARVLRLQRAVRLLTAGGQAAQVAVTCGFYDQAHLSGEIALMTGRTVSGFLADRTASVPGPPTVDRLGGQVTSVVLPANGPQPA